MQREEIARAEQEEAQQFVTFAICDEEYAIEALKVHEITGLPPITIVPYLPFYIKGMINLRGTVIPVIDLRLKFGFEAAEYTRHTCIIVTKMARNVMGMIVDAVSEVINLPKQSIDPTPPFGGRVRTDFMKGVGKAGDRLLIILDSDRVLTDEEISEIEVAVAS